MRSTIMAVFFGVAVSGLVMAGQVEAPPAKKSVDGPPCERLFISAVEGGASVERLWKECSDARDSHGAGVAMWLVRAGRWEDAARVVGARALFAERDSQGNSVLHDAAAIRPAGHMELAREWVRVVGNPDPKANDGSTPLRLALSAAKDVSADGMEMARFLISKGANKNAARNDGDSLLHNVAAFGSVGQANLLGIGSMEAKDASGRTPLALAMMTGNGKVAEWLLSNGANARAMLDGRPVFFMAAGDPVLLGKIDAGILKMQAADGHSLAHAAAAAQSLGGLEAALAAGVSANSTDVVGRTPLMIAAGKGFSKGVALLLERGANVCLADKSGKLAWEQSAKGNDRALLKRKSMEKGCSSV